MASIASSVCILCTLNQGVWCHSGLYIGIYIQILCCQPLWKIVVGGVAAVLLLQFLKAEEVWREGGDLSAVTRFNLCCPYGQGWWSPGCQIILPCRCCGSLWLSNWGRCCSLSWWNRWELPGNCPVFTVVMVNCHYVEIIWRILVTPNFLYNIYDQE